MIIEGSMEEMAIQGCFLGYLLAEAFLLVLSMNSVTEAEDRIERRLYKVLDYFYIDNDHTSNVFDGKHLSVNIEKMLPGSEEISGLPDLKTKLEILCG